AAGRRVAADWTGQREALPRGVAWATYRSVQGALTNAARHGDGEATVVIRYRPDAVEITVTNPATGGPAGPARGHGIVGMRERALLLGGTLQARRVGGEFRLEARLPYAETVAA